MTTPNWVPSAPLTPRLTSASNSITDAQSAQASGLNRTGGWRRRRKQLRHPAYHSFVSPVSLNRLISPPCPSPVRRRARGFRFVPDVSLLASPNFPGYIYCTQQCVLGLTGTGSACDPGGATGITNALALGNSPIVGGTSVGTPVFAGMVALLNQFLAGPATPGLGNINPMLYSLAAAQANNYFHHVNTGTNTSFVRRGRPSRAFPCPGWRNPRFRFRNLRWSTGYNLVTGLGSVDLNNLASAWGSTGAATTLALAASATTANVGASVTFTATVSPTTATGEVVFVNNGSSIGAALMTSGVATLATTALPTGSNSVTATYLGDGSNARATSAAVTVTIGAATFTLTPPTAAVTVTQGSAVDVSVNFGGFSAPVTFTCTEPATLTESVCTPPAAAQAAGKVSFHITTTAPSFASNLDSDPGHANLLRRATAGSTGNHVHRWLGQTFVARHADAGPDRSPWGLDHVAGILRREQQQQPEEPRHTEGQLHRHGRRHIGRDHRYQHVHVDGPVGLSAEMGTERSANRGALLLCSGFAEDWRHSLARVGGE